MIFGIGVDIVQITRIEKAMEKHGDKFAKKILSETEFKEYLEYESQAANKKINFLAKHFAAKEAFAKALGTGFRDGLTLKQIQLSHNKTGQPVLIITGRAKQKIDKLNIRHYHVSLSDERDHVVAFVTLEGRVRHNH